MPTWPATSCGYDGPFPPPNDLRLHRYFFRLFALTSNGWRCPTRFTAADVLHAMHGHVLAEAAIYGTYSLHPQVAAERDSPRLSARRQHHNSAAPSRSGTSRTR